MICNAYDDMPSFSSRSKHQRCYTWHVAGDMSDYVAADVASDVDVHVSTFYWATGHAVSSPRVLL